MVCRIKQVFNTARLLLGHLGLLRVDSLSKVVQQMFCSVPQMHTCAQGTHMHTAHYNAIGHMMSEGCVYVSRGSSGSLYDNDHAYLFSTIELC